MFERYTEKARRVIFFARYEASQFGSPYIETEHLLLGLLREDKRLMEEFMVPRAQKTIREEVEGKYKGRKPYELSPECVPLSQSGYTVLSYAQQEADELKSASIDTVHILLGILRDYSCLAFSMLRERAVYADDVRSFIERDALIYSSTENVVVSEDKRIYVVVAETVDTPNGVVVQPCGRAMAQACHSIGKMQVTSREYYARERLSGMRIGGGGLGDFWEDFPFQECATIILAARDSAEISHVDFLLMKSGVERYSFCDTNDAVYGESARIMTAVCTVPVDPNKMVGILDYLPLWSHSRDTRSAL